MLKELKKGATMGIGFTISVISLVYAATTITGIGQKTIESGDKIGTGWFNEVDDKVDNFGSLNLDCFEAVGEYRNGLVGGTKSYKIPSSYTSNDNTGEDVCQGVVDDNESLTGDYNCFATVDYDGDHTNVNTCFSSGHASWVDDAVTCCKVTF